ncbi:hypothetical protein [Candidatus Rariloculus sp.]|uniref:hypothetical protein n=1 Tax=Candidatus Rariloculus sp. TaxID=3101265 RepID=UPI003D10BEAD
MHNKTKIMTIALTVCGLLGAGAALTQPPTGPMSFFITSAGSGNGGDLGGLEGADAICQNLAESVDQGQLTWRAYLSTQGSDGVNARDRIGTGPWFNANGNQIAPNVDALHSMGHRMSAFTGIDQNGNRIPGSGYAPNRHDILTGSQPDGTAYPDGEDMTCGNWTSSSDGEGERARVGHHDYAAWGSAHNSAGCSQAALIATGGDGLFYCFAVNTTP